MKSLLVNKRRGIYTKLDDADFDRIFEANKYYFLVEKYGHVVCVERGQKKRVYLHRILLNPPINMKVDHIDGDPLNNQRSNLRICSQYENSLNRKKVKITSSTFKGVSWHKRDSVWTAYIRLHGILRSLGPFKVERDAALAYDVAAKEYFGRFACLNFA